MTVLIHPTYFPSIAHFVAMVQAPEIVFEVSDHFIKQTYRNRCYIYGANGPLALNIPVIHTQKNRQAYGDVAIFNEEHWQGQHWKSLLSAYRTSPFFEFYEDDLYPLFHSKAEHILKFNMKCLKVVCDCLQLNLSFSKTNDYQEKVEGVKDLRFLANAKQVFYQAFTPYTQVFQEKHGFINNLSILDLLFNEGPNALQYLESQTLKPL